MPSQDDRGDEYEDNSTQATQRTEAANIGGSISNEDMINITSCNFSEFSGYMKKQYGQNAFDKGFSIVKSKSDLIYQDNGEEILVGELRSLF